MQSVHATLLTRLRDSFTDPTIERKPCDLFEFYDHDYIPDPVNGFEPVDAVETFAAIDVTWNGIAYRRSLVSRGSIERHMGQQTNSVSLTFENVTGYLATWAQTTTIEGMWVVVRYVERDITAGSAVLFVGKAGKPSTINNQSFSITASQDLLDLNAELPTGTFSAQDPEGRSPSDPLYEGIRFVAIAGSLNIPQIIPAQNTLARLFGQRDTIYVTKQWSSHDATPEGQPIREVLGRAQVELLPFLWADKGVQIAALWAACAGPIQAIENIKTRTSGWGPLINSFEEPPDPPEIHLGDLGGTGTNAAHPIGWPNAGYFSHLAYVSASSVGSAIDVEDTPPTVTALVVGRRVPTPNASGVYPSIAVESTLEWTDNPVHLTRWIFIVSGADENFLEDSVNYLTSLWCDEPLLDEANTDRTLILSGDIPQAGTGIVRYISSGRINARFLRYWFGDPVEEPWLEEPTYEPLDPQNVPTNFTIQKAYRKRYTFNAPITERVKAIDFLYKVVYPTFRGYHTINSKGKIEIKSEKASDNCLLRAATIVGATQLLVDDVTPWKENLLLQGKLLIGGTIGLTTSEVRRASTATYTADGNAITLTASKTGSVTVTASGATLSGGSTTVQASGTVTVGGTPTFGDTITVTIGGIAVIYPVDVAETTTSTAAMLAHAINADSQLKRFIKATSSGAVLTVKAKYGILNLDSALANTHTGPRAAPVAGPTLGQTAGTMGAGTYKVAYAYVTAVGRTTVGPTTSIVLTANKKIDITSLGALPGGVTSVNWYVSAEPDVDKLVYYTNNAGGAFSITELPSKDNPGIPAHNTTGEECIRVAMSFATNTQGATVLAQAGLTRGNANDYNYPLGSEQSSINQIKGNYRDAKNDFALTPFLVRDPVHYALVKKWKPLEVDYSGVDNWHQAFRLANAAMSKNREGDWFNSLSQISSGEALLLEEGDVITASDASGGLINVASRIESLSISPTWEVSVRKARKYSTLMFSDDVRQHDIPLPSSLRYVHTADTQMVPMDLPFWRETDPDTAGFHLATSKALADGDWRGMRLYGDASGEYVGLTEKVENTVPIGVSTNALTATTNTQTLDTVSTVRVQITTPADGATYVLTSTTEEKLKAGANKYALGINGRWEIAHFQTATLVGGTDDTYDLTVHLRGRHGTGDHTSDHAISDKFVLLTDADGNDTGVTFVPLDIRLMNHTFNLKAVTTNQDVADATAQSFAWTGKVLQLLPTINHRGTRDSGNDLLIECEGQTRIGGGLRSLQGGAVNEEEQEYRAQILNSGSTTLPNGRERVLSFSPGMAQAAFLVSTDGTSVSHNRFNPTDPTTQPSARTLQEIPNANNWIEGAIRYSLTSSPIGLGLQKTGGAWKGLGPVLSNLQGTGGGASTVTGDLAIPYLVAITPETFGGNNYNRFHVYEYGTRIFSSSTLAGQADYDEDFGWFESPGGVFIFRVRFNFVGSSVRIEKAHAQGIPLKHVVTGTRAADFPVFGVATANSSGALDIAEIFLTTRPFPKTIYSAAQQTEDGFTPGNPIQMDVWQHSKISGAGVKTRVTL